jgi:Glycoside Hydrolase Family 113
LSHLRLHPVLIVLSILLLSACEALPQPTEMPALPSPPPLPIVNVARAAPPRATPLPTPTDAAETVTPTLAFPSPTLPPITTRVPSHDLAALNEYQKGVAYVALNNGAYQTADSDRSLDELFATGANYISLLVMWYQTGIHSTDIHPTADTPSDQDLAHVIDYAHAHGVHVLLKPQVNFTDDPDHWRGEIAFANPADWQTWFASYRQFIVYYARFAQQHGVEEFSVGTELASASTHTSEWRATIRAVRAEYTGLLTYSANHSGEEVQVQFWDDLDFIGVNNFYHLTNYRNPTIAQLIDGWKWPILQLTRLHARFPNQPIIFTEVGYPSLDRANVWPWNWNREAAVDLQEQADCYEALFRVWWKNSDRPWFRGLFIWNWLTDPHQGGAQNGDYTPHDKPAGQVLRAWFTDAPLESPLSAMDP